MKSNFKVSLADDMTRVNIVMIVDIFDKINFPQHETSKCFPQGETRILMKHTRKMLKVEIMIFSL